MGMHGCDCGLEIEGCLYPRCPQGEYDDKPCDHDDYEVDIILGEATCDRCGHRWIQTDAEIKAEAQRMADHDEAMRRYEFRERWFWWWDRARHAIARWRRPKPVIDDDLPF